MLDAYIIDRMKQEREQREQQERAHRQLPAPEPPLEYTSREVPTPHQDTIDFTIDFTI